MEMIRGGFEPAYGFWPAPPPPPPPVLMLPPPAIVPVPVSRPVGPPEGVLYDEFYYDPAPVVPETRCRVYQKPTTTDLSDDELRQVTKDWQKSGAGYKSYVVGPDRSLTVVDSDDVIVFPSAQKQQCKWRVLRQQVQSTPQEQQTTSSSSAKFGKLYPADSIGYLARPTAGYVVPAVAPPVVYPPARRPAGGYYYPPAPVPARPDLVYDPYASAAAYGGYY